MFKKNVVSIFVVFQILLLVLITIGFSGQFTTPARAAATKIMPLGDSITGSPGCWRAILWNRLQTSGFTNIDFVGTLNNSNDCGITYDGNNEGHGGYLATNIANQNLLPSWLSATTPDIVIMHLGTNDVWNNIAPATILAAFSTMVDQMRANNPNVKIIVAQIIPMNPSGCSTCAQGAVNFNAAIPAWASSKSTAQSPITVVDQWTGFSTSADTSDGVHPNATGIQKMSDKWYPALSAVLSGIVVPTNTPTRTVTGTGTGRSMTPATTRTFTPTPIGTGATPTRTRTPTNTGTGPVTLPPPTLTRTITPTTGPSATQPTGGACSPVTSTVTAPFTYDGAGVFCWQSSNLGSYINSWNLVSLTVNGVNYSNVWAATGSLPAKINGFWYVSYNSTVGWGHFEAK